jgi:hypothetical protein
MQSYSKEGQDIFVSTLIKKPGFFLDIGCAEPIENNNTYALERMGWRGVLIDENEKNINRCKAERNPSALCSNVKEIHWKAVLTRYNMPNVIDYISLDVDDANINVIQNFPFDEYEFKIMTYETDKYNNIERQRVCKEVLSKYPQYELILEDALLEDGKPWEDWWINKSYFDYNSHCIWDHKSKGIYWKEFLEDLAK